LCNKKNIEKAAFVKYGKAITGDGVADSTCFGVLVRLCASQWEEVYVYSLVLEIMLDISFGKLVSVHGVK